MAVYCVTGKLGTGKTKFCVWQAQLALRQGRRVASNVDLHLGVLLKPWERASYVRIPDKPTGFDLEAVGHGNPDSYDEDRNGVMVLDELGTWLNARSFQDKGRAAVLDFLIHARKLGWDVFLIVQDAGMVDKQVREALVEYEAKCLRLDKVRVPIIGGIINDVFGGRWGYLPRMHLVCARIGQGPQAVVAERWQYRGDWLHKAYDTRQRFRADYPDGAHSVLHPAFFDGPPGRPSWLVRLGLRRYRPPAPAARRELKPKVPEIQSLQRLNPDEAWRAARDLARGPAGRTAAQPPRVGPVAPMGAAFSSAV